ncbi:MULTISPECIES: hypothetical protein [unclassified Kribbella]
MPRRRASIRENPYQGEDSGRADHLDQAADRLRAARQKLDSLQ